MFRSFLFMLVAAVLAGPSSARADGRLRNLAVGKPSTQSSTSFGAAPSRANDGNPDGVFNNGSVSHTDERPGSWWQVDLETEAYIDVVKIMNRTDCCGERLTNYVVRISPDGEHWRDFQHPETAPRVSETVVRDFGRFVQVRLNGRGYLSLAEVEVIGDPDRHREGRRGGAPDRAPGGGGVTLFADSHYQGASQFLPPGRYDIGVLMSGIGNDKLSSLKVPPGFTVVLFQDGGFHGRSKTVTRDVDFLSDFNDLASAVVVTGPSEPVYAPPQPVYAPPRPQPGYARPQPLAPQPSAAGITLFADGQYGGRSQFLAPGRYDIGVLVGGIGNDALSSLQVPPGFSVVVFQDDGFHGRSKTFTQDTPWVGNDFNDLASSLVVTGPAEAYAPPPPPATPGMTAVEAGPIWSNEDANSKCPGVCGSRQWTGQWWTTVQNTMSVCQCTLTAAPPPPPPPAPVAVQNSSQYLTTDKAVYRVGESVTVSWVGIDGSQAWVTVIRKSEPTDSWGDWKYTGGASGSRTISSPLEPGEYEARAYFDSGTNCRDRVAFTVVP